VGTDRGCPEHDTSVRVGSVLRRRLTTRPSPGEPDRSHGRGTCAPTLALLLWHVSPGPAVRDGFAGGVLFVLFSAADAGALPNIVEKDQLTSAVAAQQASSSATAMVAPVLGGPLRPDRAPGSVNSEEAARRAAILT
jgi:hypothetical protein